MDLKRLAKTNSKSGELAGVLTGVIKEPKDKEVQAILHNFKQVFKEFRTDMEVRNMMTALEDSRADGIVEGIEKEKEKAETALKMLRKGYKIEDIADIIEMPLLWIENLDATSKAAK